LAAQPLRLKTRWRAVSQNCKAALGVVRQTRRLRWLATGIAVTAFVISGLMQVRLNTNIESFLPSSDPTVQELRDHDRSFGGDPLVVLLSSQQPSQLLAPDALPRLVGLEGQLAEIPHVADVYGPGTVLNQIAGQAQNLLARISGRRDALRSIAQQQAQAAGDTPAQEATAVKQSTAAFDLRYGSLLVQGLPAGLPTLRNHGFVQSILFGPDGAPKPQWRYLVPSPTSVALLVRPAFRS
jgi:hypothetical protein